MFNLQELKQLFYTILKNDATLISLLDGHESIYHFYPKQEDNVPYPIVVYSILGIQDNQYNPDIEAGINKLTLNIDIFSDNSSTKEADDIADRIYALLHAKNISNDNILAYTCFRVYQDESYEDNSQTWRINARYEVTNTSK
jgi:hypothetical protein